MVARSQSSFPRADRLVVATAAALGIALFSAAWALLHTGPFDDAAIVDTPVYQGYGERVLEGEVPYRDFELEYPPGALPAFVVPALGTEAGYASRFELAMLVCGAALVALVAVALGAASVRSSAVYGGVAFAALAPLLLGPVVLTRFDLWPAFLLTGALAALAGGRGRLGLAVLALASTAKLYPLVVLPPALVYVWRRRGRREALACLAVFAAAVTVVVLPFALLAPDGVLASLERQTGRPLQIESLGAGALLAADRLGLYEATVVSSHGSQNLAGALPDGLAAAQTAVQGLAIVAAWLLAARGRAEALQLFAGSAAAVAAFVAFGKVLSPQFLIWLLALVPLVAGRRGVVPGVLLAAALVLTHLWFPYRYWDVVAIEPVAWLVLARDLVLVALVGALFAATARGRGARGSP